MSAMTATTSSQVHSQSEPNPPSQYIMIKVVGQDGGEIHFRVKKGTLMGKLKKSYIEKTEISSVRFLFDGHRVGDEDTPEKLGMEDGDMIEVFQEQQGGC